ncbi:transmembrane sensor [Parabacteroides sp. PFB2-12]|uniref:FecR family protein n=1 Tax=unclassified Parabacteroides TaxID=2649774 RepID=UPI0024752E38|nr:MULTISPECIES: FecR family protein [unclassified Parabacteroides]MDH6343220.1 transmembrane sensor [Parabacteroides sp. PM6-13]MDH6392138.1 transmembrane sensor [Parabacteroides sp. PFB2-12]
MLTPNFRIAHLIAGHIAETLTPEEQQELHAWRDESAEHEHLFQQIRKEENIAAYLYDTGKFPKEEGWQVVNSRIHTSLRRKQIIRILSYAAIILFPLLIGTMVITLNKQQEESQLAHTTQPVTILPGERKAMLTLGNGQVIDLQQTEQMEVNEDDGTTIDIDQTTLSYQTVEKKAKSQEVIYNKIDIPHGGEYSLFLADGTKVYLNAMSSLRYPVRFTGDTRTVELAGEAYFEVTRSDKPFIVQIGEMRIEVLGTTFNIAAYPGEQAYTTLVDGRVKVLAHENGAEVILKPSEQAVFNTETDDFSVATVDVSLYTSWINGKIHFKDERLEDIMKSLSRWYDIEIVYKDKEVRDIRFGCNVDRYENINPFLELLEKTEKVKISMDNKRIIIQSRK